MKNRLYRLKMVSGLLLALSAPLMFCGCERNLIAGSSTDSKDSLDNFRQWATDFAKKPHESVVLKDPEKWFAEHFESGTAADLADEYKERMSNPRGLVNAIEKLRNKGRTEVKVRQISKAIDTSATGLQNAAMQRMKKPVTLYTLTLVEPGKESGTNFDSFAMVDGKFVFVGKFTALNPTRGDLVTDLLCSLPLANAEKLLGEKDMLKGSAADYLKDKGILK